MRRIAALLLLPAWAAAHGGTPQVNQISFPTQLGQRPFALTDNQGVFAGVAGVGYRWLCEDAVRPSVDMLSVALMGAGERMLVATLDGVLASDDGGCTWAPVEGPLGAHLTAGLWPHPSRPDEVLTVSVRPDGSDDVFRSTDGGRTWTGAGLTLTGRTRGLLRAPSNAARVYLASGAGAFRSDDAGATFEAITLGPPALDVRPAEFDLLAVSPDDADTLFAFVERFPDTLILRSTDAGATWAQVLAVPDVPKSLVFACAGDAALLVSPFDGFRRSADGGKTWAPAPSPVERIGVVEREPETARLWASTNVFFGGPWVLAYSDDFGRTWTPHFERYQDIDARWTCPADSTTARECGDFCPGLPPGATCPTPTPDPAHADPPPARRCDGRPPARPPTDDVFAVDGGIAAPPPADGAVGDGAVEPGRPDGTGGCAAATAPSSRPPLALCLLAWTRWRRRRR